MDEIERALAPGSFFVARPGRLRVQHADEEVPWEVFQGHLLGAGQTRELASFEAWHLFHDLADAPSYAPLISIRLDRPRARIHVTRQILTYGFEAYEDTPGVFLSRPAQKWVAELVGTICLDALPAGQWTREIATYVWLAIVGTSRLPITSLESPLPAFSLAQIGYVPLLGGSEAAASVAIAFMQRALAERRPADEREADLQAKALETALRAIAADEVPRLVDALWGAAQLDPGDRWLRELFLRVFHGVALSPYTQFAARLVDTLQGLAKPNRLGAAAVSDILGAMLRHLCRHLTAFDLVTFHNLGANYPDALFLDALLKAYVRLLDADPANSADTSNAKQRHRRRALREACLVRKSYEGHRVPDAPTSTGENARVLPAPFVRVPAEQIMQPGLRRRVLYEGEPLESLLSEATRRVLDASLDELETSGIELRQLGMAGFLDRPLGACKLPNEVDRTPLVASEAFSRSIAARRLGLLRADGWLNEAKYTRLMELLAQLSVPGMVVRELTVQARPGVVSLADASQAATDFILIRSMPGSLAQLWSHYDWQPLWLTEPQVASPPSSDEPLLLVSTPPAAQSRGQAILRLLDQRGQVRLEVGLGPANSQPLYVERGGIELPRRLRVLSWATAEGPSCDLKQQTCWIELRDR